ncbi:MAG TPA: L,D-transpeptidase [Bryobacteraceae bacterium]|nr:L,D-transpeptidase [Bryobacteraceae bacterium]
MNCFVVSDLPFLWCEPEDPQMYRTVQQWKRLGGVASALLVAAAGAWAQEQPAAGRRRVVVSIPDRKLALLEDGRVVRVFPIAVGARSTPSPTGSYEVVERLVNPTWYYRGKVVPPGKDNPLGTRWLGLSCTGFGIHGTNNPRSIGRRVSHGCIRMRNSDVEQLFPCVSRGDIVELHGQPDPAVDRIFHPVAATVAFAAGQ